MSAAEPLIVAVIGAGPRGSGWLERAVENLREGGPGAHAAASRGIRIVLVDPHTPGPGHIWRREQSPLLKLNSLAQDVTVFTDASSTIDGPVVPGPSLAEWAEQWRAGELADVVVSDPTLREELRALTATSFPTRRLQSLYLDWFHRRTLARVPAGVTVEWRRAAANGVDDVPDAAGAVVWLDDGTRLRADVVLYALGHSGSDVTGEHARLQAFAAEHDAWYLPPAFTADAELAGLPAGEDVIVRGFGLAAVDLVVLLTEGRGGRFETDAAGGLRYLPSGREPRLHLGSRRGVPYHSKITSQLVGSRPEPEFFHAGIAEQLIQGPGLDFARDVWPLIAKEALHGYYAELFTGHPERVRIGWDEFLVAFRPLDAFGDELRALTAASLVDPADALDLERFDRPLRDRSFADREALQRELREYIRDDVHRRTAPEHSATQGFFLSLLFAYFGLAGILDHPNWSAESIERDLHGWWHGYFSYVASGPPTHRLHELLALSEAGVVDFLGPDLVVTTDASTGRFLAESPAVPGTLHTRHLVDAWLPANAVATSDNPALRQLVGDGRAGREHVVADGRHTARTGLLAVRTGDARLLRPDGTPHPARWAIGPYTSAPNAGAFARPGTNALSFRENDRVARSILDHLDLKARDEVPDPDASAAPSRSGHGASAPTA